MKLVDCSLVLKSKSATDASVLLTEIMAATITSLGIGCYAECVKRPLQSHSVIDNKCKCKEWTDVKMESTRPCTMNVDRTDYFVCCS